MRNVPKSRAGLLGYYQVRASKWAQHAAELQIDPQHAAEVEDLAIQARQARLLQEQAASAARAATGRYNSLIRKLRKKGGSLLMQIQVRAVYDEGVYSLAMIPRRRKKSPVAPPGRPYAFSAELLAGSGELIVKWKCRNAEGADGILYTIYRQLGEHGPMVHLACVGQREFTDDTVPPGTPIVTYQIRASRSTGAGEWETFVVKFGGGMPKEGRFTPRKAA